MLLFQPQAFSLDFVWLSADLTSPPHFHLPSHFFSLSARLCLHFPTLITISPLLRSPLPIHFPFLISVWLSWWRVFYPITWGFSILLEWNEAEERKNIPAAANMDLNGNWSAITLRPPASYCSGLCSFTKQTLTPLYQIQHSLFQQFELKYLFHWSRPCRPGRVTHTHSLVFLSWTVFGGHWPLQTRNTQQEL